MAGNVQLDESEQNIFMLATPDRKAKSCSFRPSTPAVADLKEVGILLLLERSKFSQTGKCFVLFCWFVSHHSCL
jgi:hypothetical protein